MFGSSACEIAQCVRKHARGRVERDMNFMVDISDDDDDDDDGAPGPFCSYQPQLDPSLPGSTTAIAAVTCTEIARFTIIPHTSRSITIVILACP